LLDDDWPSAGELSFDNAQLRYRPGLPLALQGVSVDIHPGEHIGVVGKTVYRLDESPCDAFGRSGQLMISALFLLNPTTERL
jgi:hypothetical protein